MVSVLQFSQLRIYTVLKLNCLNETNVTLSSNCRSRGFKSVCCQKEDLQSFFIVELRQFVHQS